MDFDYSPKTKELQARLLKFMDEHIYPAEGAYHAEIAANTAAGKRWTHLQTRFGVIRYSLARWRWI